VQSALAATKSLARAGARSALCPMETFSPTRDRRDSDRCTAFVMTIWTDERSSRAHGMAWARVLGPARNRRTFDHLDDELRGS
jgi:hypothetical protein